MLGFLFPARLRRWIGPFVIAGCGVALLGALVVVSGFVDLSAAEPHPEGWARFLHFAFDRSTAFHARGTEPPADLGDPIRIAAGAAHYGQVCAHCHSGPGLGQNPIALGMHPRPQYLVTDLPIAKFSDAELFRIVKAGVKYSAMPSWPAQNRDDEVWDVVAFLKVLPGMQPDLFRRLAVADSDRPADPARLFGPSVLPRRAFMQNDDERPIPNFSYRAPAYGFSDFALSGDPLATCNHCHGADGAGKGAFPNLTLLSPIYFKRTLWAFAHGQRQSGIMRTVASGLSPRQIVALSAYYDALPRRASEAGARADPLGEALALRGDPAKGLGPCAGCHGITRAAAKSYPPLEGQSRWYIANQMRVFKAGGRGGVEGQNPMPAIASKLDQRAIEAVAAYYSAQPPARKQSFAALAKAS